MTLTAVSGNRALPISELRLPTEGVQGHLFDAGYAIPLGLRLPLSQIVSIVGLDTGDEGKGRTCFDMADRIRLCTGCEDAVAIGFKPNGGANSGHSAGNFKFNLIPSSAADPLVPCLALGAGVVADPLKLHWEVRSLEAQGLTVWPRLRLSHKLQLSDITHRVLDLAEEHYRTVVAGTPRGSTGRGISPAFQAETGQRQIHYVSFHGSKDLFASAMRERAATAERMIQHVWKVPAQEWFAFFEKLSSAEERANKAAVEIGALVKEELDLRRFCTDQPFTFAVDRMIEEYWEVGQAVRAHITDVSELLMEALRGGRYIIVEFGQAYWLDKRHGHAPNTTSSHTTTPEFFESAGIPIQPVHISGAAKVYDTKVGTHHFPTEIPLGHPLGDLLRTIEFGTTTGRQRMVGWPDTVAKGHAIRHSGITELNLLKLDVLNYRGDWQQGKLRICAAYRTAEGKELYQVPLHEEEWKGCTPVYIDLDAWSEDLQGVRSFNELPEAAKLYVAAIYVATMRCAHLGTLPPYDQLPPIGFVGVGPGRGEVLTDCYSPARLIEMVRRAGIMADFLGTAAPAPTTPLQEETRIAVAT
ncbi:MAG: adenylosuccinate synthetase [Bdellovibrionota bacterium]|nr:MAG: adenylosuccinate synthetase [Bdellovibrionota bacterium]